MNHQLTLTEHQARGTAHAVQAMCVEIIDVADEDGFGGSSRNYGFPRVGEFDLIKAATTDAWSAAVAKSELAHAVLAYHTGVCEIDKTLCPHGARDGAHRTALCGESGVGA